MAGSSSGRGRKAGATPASGSGRGPWNRCPFARLISAIARRTVPRGRPVVTYCNCHYEHSSTRAALILEEYDFTELYILVGGITAWAEAGLALEPKSPESDSVKHLAVGPFR
jgi:rhodanese-related sulfurtransferase